MDAGDVPRAVCCAFWIGHNLLLRGETVRARDRMGSLAQGCWSVSGRIASSAGASSRAAKV
jgi:hypothetical protein